MNQTQCSLLQRSKSLLPSLPVQSQHHSNAPTAPSPTPPPAAVLDQLRRQVRAIETQNVSELTDRVLNNAPVIDRMLPERGYRRGTIVDWVAPTGCAADFLSLAVAQNACRNGGALVVIDPDRQFFPAAATAIGIQLDQVIVLRSPSTPPAGRSQMNAQPDAFSSDLLWAVDQALRCPAVSAVWGPLPQIDDRWSRRFQLSAESSGCMGLFVRPLAVARQPSWSDVQWLISPAKQSFEPKGKSNPQQRTMSKIMKVSGNDPNSFSVRLQMARCRGGHGGPSVCLSINTVTGSVQKTRRDYEHPQSTSQARSLSMAAGMANPASGRRGA